MMSKKNMKNFGILINKNIREAREKAVEIADYISAKGMKVYTEFYSRKGNNRILKTGRRGIIEKSDMIFALGGDGTFLKAAREAGKHKTPLLGVNMGSLGFMTELRSSEVIPAIDQIMAGRYEIETRMRLQVDIRKGSKIIRSFLALNDVVVQNGDIARVLNINLHIENEDVTDLLADGVIVATPTGSTAYSLSAGGPIVFPGNSCLVITPICPHTLSNRPIVITDNKIVNISILEGKSPVVTVDGQEKYLLKSGQHVRVRRSRYPLYFMKTRAISYIHVLKEKLDWKGSSY